MTTGTGLAIIGFWLPVLGAMLGKEVTAHGLKNAKRLALMLTISIVALDFLKNL